MTPKALIVGAGIAGLSAAWWLDKAGWTSILVEKAPTIRNGGYIVSLSGLGAKTVKNMGLQAQLDALSYKFEENALCDEHGREVFRLRYEDIHGGVDSLAVRRNDLSRTLFAALPESASILFNDTLVEAIDNGDHITATLRSGLVIKADLLIGADGVHSEVRGMFWEGTQCLEAIGYTYAAYDVAAEHQLASDCVSFNSPGRLDVLYSLRDNRIAALHVWRVEEIETQQGRVGIETLKRVTAGGVKQVSDVIERAQFSGTVPLVDRLTMTTISTWSKGRVLLLGDAAHCITLLSGQGAGMALASAEILAEELIAAEDVVSALGRHEEKLRPVIERLQDRTRKIAKMYIPKSFISYHLRNLLLKLLPYAWIVSWHINSAKAEITLTRTGKEI